MKSFKCTICGGVYPDSLLHMHHKIPKALGGPDTPDNLVPLCQTDHNLLHSVAYMMVPNKSGGTRVDEIEPTLSSIYPDEEPIRKRLIEYAGYAAREMFLKKELRKDENQETRIIVELPILYTQLLKLWGHEFPKPNGAPMGVGALVRVILAKELSAKFPQQSEKIRSRMKKRSK